MDPVRTLSRWHASRILTAALAGAVLTTNGARATSAQAAGASGERDWRSWPFSRRAPWNSPIGSGAQYAPVPRLGSYRAGLNYDDRWTASVVIASDRDPVATMVFSPASGPDSTYAFLKGGGRTCDNPVHAEQALLHTATAAAPPGEGNYYSTRSAVNDHKLEWPADFHRAGQEWRDTFHLPKGACPSPDPDGLLAVFQPDGWVIDIYAGVVTADGRVIGTMASWIDARGDGTGWWNGRRASMLPSFAGLIRTGEIAAGRIPHALAAQAPASLLEKAYVWPAAAFDRDSHYSGMLPMGALLAIPPSVDIARLGLSPRGTVLARAAQDYGVYVVDRGGEGLTFLAELGDPDIHWEQRDRDLAVIKNGLQWVTNNGADRRGGGGTPRAPLAPPLNAADQ